MLRMADNFVYLAPETLRKLYLTLSKFQEEADNKRYGDKEELLCEIKSIRSRLTLRILQIQESADKLNQHYAAYREIGHSDKDMDLVIEIETSRINGLSYDMRHNIMKELLLTEKIARLTGDMAP